VEGLDWDLDGVWEAVVVGSLGGCWGVDCLFLGAMVGVKEDWGSWEEKSVKSWCT